jgi:Putative  PD-(D/E)XK family member, (DUF4420)
MNDFESQWNALGAKHYSAGRLRVCPDHQLDFFIDYALNGNRELIIEAKDIVFNFPELPFFENLDVIFDQAGNSARVGITLTDEHLFKSFAVMCFDISERSKSGKSLEDSFMIVLDCLRDWSELFKRRGKVGLTRNEVIGLWGELYSLEAILMSDVAGDELIVQGWRGPNGDQRDIGFNKTRIEVKTQLATKAISLRITSLDQLDDGGNNLKLILNRITPSDKGISVIDLSQRLFQRFEPNRIAHSEFERKIVLAGLNEDLEVCHEKFDVDERLIYEVSESFPKLTLSNVPVGIKAAEYEISGAAISSFQINWDQLVETLSE